MRNNTVKQVAVGALSKAALLCNAAIAPRCTCCNEIFTFDFELYKIPYGTPEVWFKSKVVL